MPELIGNDVRNRYLDKYQRYVESYCGFITIKQQRSEQLRESVKKNHKRSAAPYTDQSVVTFVFC